MGAQRGVRHGRHYFSRTRFNACSVTGRASGACTKRAHAEHQRAQAALPDLATFIELAQEQHDDPVLQRFARRAEDVRRNIAAPPSLFVNPNALRALIDRGGARIPSA